ncbi:MAG: GNAT family N-acetyltransferase [Bdellovibrionales bacterium]|nr:GNAT family N-acetyltransferase [Bdellovibrionales bacterium]
MTEKIPSFETERLIVREVREADGPAYEKYFVNYEVIRYLAAGVPWPYPKGSASEFIRTMIAPRQGIDKWMWAITLKESNCALIGAIELSREATPSNRGFWLGEPFWGKGYMMEAVSPVTDYAFEFLGFEKLIFANAVGNARSRRIKEKSGASFLRREPGSYMDPQFMETELFELTSDTWKARTLR